MKRFLSQKINSIILGILVMISATLFLTTNGDATIFHVAKTGKDSNSGSEISPFQTIKRGIKDLTAGDTLLVHAGTYAEHFFSWETSIPNGKSWEKPITIAAHPGDSVQITPGGGKAFFGLPIHRPNISLSMDLSLTDKTKPIMASNSSPDLPISACKTRKSKIPNILPY